MWGIVISWWMWLPIIALSAFAAFKAVTDTNGAPKTAAYLMLIIMLPVIGAIIYFSVGINYRKNKIFSKKIIDNVQRVKRIREQILDSSQKLMDKYPDFSGASKELITFLLNDSFTPLTEDKVTLLVNGEEKFPLFLEDLRNAKKYIHLEYYIFEDDHIGRKVIDILKEKAEAGLEVRLIYDDFGSSKFGRAAREIEKAGARAYAFQKVLIYNFTNRINYRDHRKILIVDGMIGYVGGINIADRYVNDGIDNKVFWRDTHIRLEGDAVKSLQQHFISNWNFCSGEQLEVNEKYFPKIDESPDTGELVQIIAGGPDYARSSLMLSIFTAITEAEKCIYIATPYFIPNETIQNALIQAAVSGKDVRLLVPDKSDSKLVNYASQHYYSFMLEAGVRIFRYQKGFVHSKIIVVDDDLSMVGSANMDLRSFEINFEINAAVYSKEFNQQLMQVFLEDLDHSVEIDKEDWKKRSRFVEFRDSLARIVSPLL